MQLSATAFDYQATLAAMAMCSKGARRPFVNVFEATDARSEAFRDELKNNNVCLDGHCRCHTKAESETGLVSSKFRQYLSTTQNKGFTAPMRIMDATLEFFFAVKEELCRLPSLKRCDDCKSDHTKGISEDDFVTEFSHINMREPINLPVKGGGDRRTNLSEHLFSVKVKKADGRAAVVRTFFSPPNSFFPHKTRFFCDGKKY
tara:strand:- start:531 stop:1139 length:609 start_codon:yes stop_codon:yes gene_type:complete